MHRTPRPICQTNQFLVSVLVSVVSLTTPALAEEAKPVPTPPDMKPSKIKPSTFADFQDSVKKIDMAKHTMTLAQFEKSRSDKNFYVLDLRSEHEFKAGHIKDAQHLGADIDAEKLKKLLPNKDVTVMIYCSNSLFPTRQIALTYPSLSQFLSLGYAKTYALEELWHGDFERSRNFTKGPLWDNCGKPSP